jgi:hypothetical protein
LQACLYLDYSQNSPKESSASSASSAKPKSLAAPAAESVNSLSTPTPEATPAAPPAFSPPSDPEPSWETPASYEANFSPDSSYSAPIDPVFPAASPEFAPPEIHQTSAPLSMPPVLSEPSHYPIPGQPLSGLPETDWTPFQGILSDPQTRAFSLWSRDGLSGRELIRDEALSDLSRSLPSLLPGEITSAITGLEGGIVEKVCFAFEHLTTTSYHAQKMNAGLVTGPINQSLLTMVRTENAFQKRAAQSSPERKSA